MSKTMMVRFVMCIAVTALLIPGGAGAAEEAAPAGPGPVLDSYSYWRGHVTFRPIVHAEKAEGASTPEGNPRTEAPPSGWAEPDFDDGRWFRMCGSVFGGGPNGWGSFDGGGGTQQVSMICLRGRFNVADPALVESLSRSAT